MPENQNNDQIFQETASLQENQDFGKDLELSKTSSDACSQRPRSNIPIRIISIFGGILEIIVGVFFIFMITSRLIENGIEEEHIVFLVFFVAMTISGITYLLTGILRTFFCKKGYLKSIGLVLSTVINIILSIYLFVTNDRDKSFGVCILGSLSLPNILVYLGVSFQDKVPFLRFFAPFKWAKPSQ